MAVADISHRKPADDELDSIASTPPGAVTPQPDLSDKRLPGINSCFGQVRNAVSHSFTALSSAFATNTKHKPVSSPDEETSLTESMASSITLQDPSAGFSCAELVSSHAESSLNEEETKARSNPVSSSSSTHEVDSIRSRGCSSTYDHCADVFPNKPSSLKRPSRANSRTHSYSYIPRAFTPLPEVNTSSAVATLVSALFTKTSALPSDPSSHISKSPCQSISSKKNENTRLTMGVSSPSLKQSTPPQTPRTQSQEDATGSGYNTPAQSSSSNDNIKTDGTTIGPVLGTLTVLIKEGRGLRPSVDPYVVCEFQLSQYISDGPVSQDTETTNGASGVTIQPAAGRGRPMAIPMKSRQSSSSGRDTTQSQEVTNPRWDHKAVL